MLPLLLFFFGLQIIDASPLASRALVATTLSKQTCKTYITTKSTSNVPTSTKGFTVTLNPPVLVTNTPVTTTTPKTSTTSTTTTITATTTLSVVTDTFKTTSTSTQTITVSSTLTDTSTATETTITTLPQSTTTVPVPAGFRYPTPTPGNVKREADANPIPAEKHFAAKQALTLDKRAAANRCVKAPTKYPYKVVCERYVAVIVPITFTKTASKTKTLTAPTPTATSTISTTTTTTSTLPNASVTESYSTTTSTTTTVFTTMTTTSTTTSTVQQEQPTATYYAACGPANQVSTDGNGNPLGLVSESAPQELLFNTDNAYECCAACMATANCAGANYIASFSAQGASCENAVYNSCPANQGQVADPFESGGFPNPTFSNGLCGYYSYVG